MRTDLEKVERNLARWQGLIKGQRHTVVAGAVTRDWISKRPDLMDKIQSESASRDRRLAELVALYGKAVGAVPGAVEEDLLTLDRMGLLLLDPPETD